MNRKQRFEWSGALLLLAIIFGINWISGWAEAEVQKTSLIKWGTENASTR